MLGFFLTFEQSYDPLPAWEKCALIAKKAVESASIGGAIGSKASVVGKNKQPYQPNKGAIGNMGEFFKQSGFSNQIKNRTLKTSKRYHGQSIYQTKVPIKDHSTHSFNYQIIDKI
ncbi:hypothetical protein [Photorhabdus akhurstii]|uniref:hypothetical protein n=1 Tax=Photorhabdus akhurstii TaxID=171438 RepID=UPI00370487C4